MVLMVSTIWYDVNATSSYVTKIHGQHVFLVISVVEHRGWCSPKGEGFLIGTYAPKTIE